MKKPSAIKPLDVLTQVTTTPGRQFWKKIGVAFPIKDGVGFALKLDYIPKDFHRNLQMVILPNQPKKR